MLQVIPSVEFGASYKHNIDTIIKLKQKLNKENHPKFGTVTSSETKKAISRLLSLLRNKKVL